jgi:hypothetical protein
MPKAIARRIIAIVGRPMRSGTERGSLPVGRRNGLVRPGSQFIQLNPSRPQYGRRSEWVTARWKRVRRHPVACSRRKFPVLQRSSTSERLLDVLERSDFASSVDPWSLTRKSTDRSSTSCERAVGAPARDSNSGSGTAPRATSPHASPAAAARLLTRDAIPLRHRMALRHHRAARPGWSRRGGRFGKQDPRPGCFPLQITRSRRCSPGSVTG